MSKRMALNKPPEDMLLAHSAKLLDLWKNGETVDEVIEDLYKKADNPAKPSVYIHAFRTSIRKAMKESDPVKKLAMINCFEEEIQQLMEIQAFEGAKFEELSEKEKEKS
jgi:hypothetical protein